MDRTSRQPRETTRLVLERARKYYDQRAWSDAFREFSVADQSGALNPDDLGNFSITAYLIGHEDIYIQVLDRMHCARSCRGELALAARAAFWLGLQFSLRGEIGQATGWFGRGERLLHRAGKPCAEEGYFMLPHAEQQLQAGDGDTAYRTAIRAAEIGDSFADADLSICARHLQGRAMIRNGQVEKGLAILDETMLGIKVDHLSPIMAGLVYCSVIDACQQIYATDRAREWTNALSNWCAAQPQLVAFTGRCVAHRAEILQLTGHWSDAIKEVRRISSLPSGSHSVPAAAYYQQGEIHRLRGEFSQAEQAYEKASRVGTEPMPGLALLRLAQGDTQQAAVALSRALDMTADQLERLKLLPAYVDVMILKGDLAEASRGARELEESAKHYPTIALRALSASATGAVQLASDDFRAALQNFRRTVDIWQQVKAPYAIARTRELMGLACRALGDEDGAKLEFLAAREAFKTLGATPDLARIDSRVAVASHLSEAKLTKRELQVLQLIATGKPNKVIAAELALSQKTISRHIGNIFIKLDVNTRAAATAWAYQHRLV
jgi:DNA-binding CsgD family transcriptional regulator